MFSIVCLKGECIDETQLATRQLLTPRTNIHTHNFGGNIFMINRDLLSIPSNIMKKFIVLAILNFFSTFLMDVMTFFMQFSKEALSHGKIALSLICISIYYLKSPLQSFFNFFRGEYSDILQEEQNIIIAERACNALYKVTGKVTHANDANGYQEAMSNKDILMYLNRYIDNTWRKKTFFVQNFPNIISSIVLFFGLIASSTLEIENTEIFTLILICSVIIEYFFNNYEIKIDKLFSEERRKNEAIQNEAEQNVLQIKSAFDAQADFRVKDYIDARKNSFRTYVKRSKTDRKNSIGLTFSFSLFSLLVIALKIFENGVESVTLETLISAIALATIYERFIQKIKTFFEFRSRYNSILNYLETYSPHFENIHNVYLHEIRNENLPLTKLQSMTIPAFSIRYKASKEKDDFSLHSLEDFTFIPGDFILLTGESGSGKSTFMQIITEDLHFPNISLQTKTLKDGRVKKVFHEDRTSLGSKSVLEEITLGQKDFDKEKLLNILHVLHLYEETASGHDDVFEYFANVGVKQFSKGQQQRLAIACSLFNIDEHHQVIALDEITNNLNDELALNVLTYIKEQYRDRIVLLATHQVNLASKLANKRLEFVKGSSEKSFLVTENN